MVTANNVEQARRDGVLLGVPLGDLGWFQCLLMGTAMGMAAFFFTTLVAIFAMLFYQMATHQVPRYEMSYRHFGFPVGAAVMALSLGYLGLQWAKRKARGR